jgi:hypothetical protein
MLQEYQFVLVAANRDMIGNLRELDVVGATPRTNEDSQGVALLLVMAVSAQVQDVR